MGAPRVAQVPGSSLRLAAEHARANPQLLMAVTAHGGHLGWCERDDPWGRWAGPAWCERAVLGFLETSLGMQPKEACETIGCEVFD